MRMAVFAPRIPVLVPSVADVIVGAIVIISQETRP